MAARNSIIPPAYLPYLANTAAALGTIPAAIGVGLLIQPQFGLKVLQFPTPTSPQDRNLVEGLTRIYGARDLAIGITTLAIWYYGDGRGGANYKVLGSAMLAGTLLVATDGWVSRLVIGKAEWNHWSFVPLNIGLGLSLLGWV